MSQNDIGLAIDQGPRENIEDKAMYLIVSFSEPNDFNFTILTLCDGVGGAHYGEVASANATTQLACLLQTLFVMQRPTEPKQIEQTIALALTRTNTAILNLMIKDSRLQGMATTAVCAVLYDDLCCVGWVGDSRAYVWNRHDHLVQLTRDHSETQQLIDAGILDVSYGHLSHAITRCLGMESSIFEPETTTYHIRPGDVVMLCSDGLTDVLDDSQIAEIISQGLAWGHPVTKISHSLVQRALAAKTTDNTTVLCCMPSTEVSISQNTRTGGEYHLAISDILLNKELPCTL